VSQKLGTVYSLKDFYKSDHLVKNDTTNLFQKNRFTYEKKAEVFDGKQGYTFTKVNRKPKSKKVRKEQDGTNSIIVKDGL